MRVLIIETVTETRMIVESATKRFRPRPIPAGWALDAVLRCDEAHPGFARFLMQASNLRRQGVFLALTQIDWERPEIMAGWITRITEHPNISQTDPVPIIAQGLISIRVRDLVQGVFGSVPNGLVGALARCGDNPLDESGYELLRAIFDDPKNGKRSALLRQVSSINRDLVEVVWRLPSALLHPMVLEIIYHPEQIGQYAAAVNVIRKLHPDLTDEDLATSLGQMAPGSSLRLWAKRWMERAEKLPSELPYAGDEMIRPLVSGSELKAAARKYRNCLRSRIPVVALGRYAYYEFSGEEGAIAEIHALSRGLWVLQGVYGPNNMRPSPRAVRALRTALEGAGVLVAAKHIQSSEMEEVADLMHVFDGGGSWLDVPDEPRRAFA